MVLYINKPNGAVQPQLRARSADASHLVPSRERVQLGGPRRDTSRLQLHLQAGGAEDLHHGPLLLNGPLDLLFLERGIKGRI